MTPARIKALRWFHERGETAWFDGTAPSWTMRRKMIADGQLQFRSQGDFRPLVFSLTDKGRQDLHEATREALAAVRRAVEAKE